MKKIKPRTIILAVILVLVIIAAIIFTILANPRAVRLPGNPAGTIGNTAGNINNGGLFCERDGKDYFSNSFDNDTLYVMNVDETEITRISGAVISNILAGGDYIYYFQRSESGETGLGGVRVPFSFNRSLKNGKKAASILRGVVTSGQLVGDTLFLQGMDDDGAYFCSINTDGSDYKEIGRYVLNPACADNGQIYYNSTVDNHHLMRYNTQNGVATDLLSENVWNPVLYGDYVYYMDPGNDYQLRRYSLSQQQIEILTNEKVELFNVGGGYVYFQTMGKAPGLYMMAADGSGLTLMANGEFTDINMTSYFVYFKDYFDQTVTYHAFIGQPVYSAFSAASPGLTP